METVGAKIESGIVRYSKDTAPILQHAIVPRKQQSAMLRQALLTQAVSNAAMSAEAW